MNQRLGGHGVGRPPTVHQAGQAADGGAAVAGPQWPAEADPAALPEAEARWLRAAQAEPAADV